EERSLAGKQKSLRVLPEAFPLPTIPDDALAAPADAFHHLTEPLVLPVDLGIAVQLFGRGGSAWTRHPGSIGPQRPRAKYPVRGESGSGRVGAPRRICRICYLAVRGWWKRLSRCRGHGLKQRCDLSHVLPKRGDRRGVKCVRLQSDTCNAAC